jgi:acid phosphatase
MVNSIADMKKVVLLGALLPGVIAGPVYLSPVQDIILPSSESATSPLTNLGANSPWFAG